MTGVDTARPLKAMYIVPYIQSHNQTRSENSMARGGRRDGAGRHPGSKWKPPMKVLRADAVEKAVAIVNSGDDPLTVVSGWVMDTSLDMSFRLSAANCVLPFLYPRLSASQVDAKMTIEKVDPADVLRRLDERFNKLAQPAVITAEPEQPVPVIGVPPDEDA
jgi:hypothetical protein